MQNRDFLLRFENDRCISMQRLKKLSASTCSFPHFSIFEQNKFSENFSLEFFFEHPSTYHPFMNIDNTKYRNYIFDFKAAAALFAGLFIGIMVLGLYTFLLILF